MYSIAETQSFRPGCCSVSPQLQDRASIADTQLANGVRKLGNNITELGPSPTPWQN